MLLVKNLELKVITFQLEKTTASPHKAEKLFPVEWSGIRLFFPIALDWK
jgi:hypothetical protein